LVVVVGARQRAGGVVAEGYAPYLGNGYCREGGLLGEKCFEGLPRGQRGDPLACRGHPYMFFRVRHKKNFFLQDFLYLYGAWYVSTII
jgi:hypothetical protein